MLLRVLRYLLIHVGKPWGAGLKTLLNIQFHWETSLSTTASDSQRLAPQTLITKKIFIRKTLQFIPSNHIQYPPETMVFTRRFTGLWGSGVSLPKLPDKANRSRFTCFANASLSNGSRGCANATWSKACSRRSSRCSEAPWPDRLEKTN